MKEHRKILCLVVLGVAGLVVLIIPAFAAGQGAGRGQSGNVPSSGGSPSEAVPHDEQQQEKPEKNYAMPVYRPPLRGAPEGRLAGGSRSPEDGMPRLYFLAPDHVGLTTKEQPVVYWFASERPKYAVEFSIIEVATHEAILEVPLKSPTQAGIQMLRLADHGVRLKQGVLYRCFVRMMPDRSQRSKDVVSFGEIQRVEPSETLQAMLREAGRANAVFIYAREGVWFDALAAISDSVKATPTQELLRRQRAQLLEQAGLSEVAVYEIEHGFSGTRK